MWRSGRLVLPYRDLVSHRADRRRRRGPVAPTVRRRRAALPEAAGRHARLELVEVREDEQVARRAPRARLRVTAALGRSERSTRSRSPSFSSSGGERQDLCFVIGGPFGLDRLDDVDQRLSLGDMTLPHQLARVVLLEQLYRGPQDPRGRALPLLICRSIDGRRVLGAAGIAARRELRMFMRRLAILLSALVGVVVVGTVALHDRRGRVGRRTGSRGRSTRSRRSARSRTRTTPAGRVRRRRPRAARHRYALLRPRDGGGVLRLGPAQRRARGAPHPDA